MGFIQTQYYKYRNLENRKLILDAPEVFFIGENGQGKTNFIESIYLLSFGASFRTRQDNRLIKNQEDITAVKGSFTGPDGLMMETAVKITRNGRKEIRVDLKIIKDRKELIENTPCIVFLHQDMDVISGSPEKRRRFFNQTLSLFDPLFIDILRRYKKVVKSRNIVLRENKKALLDTYNQTLAATGLKIQNKRNDIVNAFNRTFTELYMKISGVDEELKIIYTPSWNSCSSEEDVILFLERSLERDIQLENTTTGPHRDNFRIIRNKKDFAHIGSTGQIRLGSLILKVAQARFFQVQTGRKPILLIDDVLLELDALKRERFINNMPDYEQAFFTFLPDEPFQQYCKDRTLIYKVVDGDFIEEQR